MSLDIHSISLNESLTHKSCFEYFNQTIGYIVHSDNLFATNQLNSVVVKRQIFESHFVIKFS